jgi:membrane protein implicated in regulation of membrane protease activity
MPVAVRDRFSELARSSAGTAIVYASLALSAITMVALMFFVTSLTPVENAALLIAALAAWVLVIAFGWARSTLPLAGVVVVIVVTLGASVSTPSTQSKDVYSYTMYGRMVTVHHANPYNNYPVHFEGDPMRRYVSSVWQRTPDVYGPAFTAVMAGFAPIIGESTFRVRFLYQLLALAAIIVLLVLMWRHTKNPLVLAFIGLQPLLAVSVVNGGHPDALIALAFFIAYLLALERRVVLCALALAFAIAVNFSVAPAAVALGVWAWRRWPKRDVIKMGAITFVVGMLPYPFLAGWLQNAREHQELISRQAIWNPIAGVVSGLGISDASLKTVMPNLTTLAAGALLIVVLWRYTSERTPDYAMAAAVAVFLVTSPWVMPWYAFAAFPLFALRKPTLLTWTVGIYSVFILVGDQYPSLSAKNIGTFGHTIYETIVPVGACLLCIGSIIWGRVQTDELPVEPAAPEPAPISSMPAVPAR